MEGTDTSFLFPSRTTTSTSLERLRRVGSSESFLLRFADAVSMEGRFEKRKEKEEVSLGIFLAPHWKVSSKHRRLLTFRMRRRRKRRDLLEVNTPFAKPNYTYYSTYDQFFSDLKIDLSNAIHSQVVRWDTFSSENGTYSAKTDIITIQNAKEKDSSQLLRVFLNFGQHGREIITSELAGRLARSFSNPESLISKFADDTTKHGLREFFANSVIKIAPMDNAKGRLLVEAGQFCERKNGRGVDLNRNWGLDWGVKAPDYDPTEEYPGTSPFSEPEVHITKKILEEYQPHIWINFHSGMEGLFTPYNYAEKIPQTPAISSALDILQLTNELYCKSKCSIGPGGNTVGYLAHGTADDFIFDKIGVPVVMTWEIYGATAHRDDCFRIFNPVTKGAYDDVISRWELGTAHFLSEALSRHILHIGGTSSNVRHGTGIQLNTNARLEHNKHPNIFSRAFADHFGMLEGFILALVLIAARDSLQKRRGRLRSRIHP